MIGCIERVRFDRALLEKCWRVAKQRYAIKAPHTDKRVSRRPGPHVHFDGLRGEAGIAQFIGKPEVVNYSIEKIGDGGTDLVIGGRRMQVKVSTYTPPYLRFNKDGSEAFTTDIAALVFVPLLPEQFDPAWYTNNGWVDLIGWITRDEFMTRATKRNFGYGERLMVEPSSLHPMTELL